MRLTKAEQREEAMKIRAQVLSVHGGTLDVDQLNKELILQIASTGMPRNILDEIPGYTAEELSNEEDQTG
jgi:hypothetical protein